VERESKKKVVSCQLTCCPSLGPLRTLRTCPLGQGTWMSVARARGSQRRGRGGGACDGPVDGSMGARGWRTVCQKSPYH
jgi:hypothetical protein